jgi:hypothetical protein
VFIEFIELTQTTQLTQVTQAAERRETTYHFQWKPMGKKEKITSTFLGPIKSPE